MHAPNSARRFALPALTALALSLLTVACGGSASAGWTYAPLGPTPAASAAASPSATGGAPSPGGSPSGNTIQVTTTQASPTAFEPATLQMPAGTAVTVDYLNDSNLPHNIEFFDGPDASSTMIGGTEQATGPGALETVTFTTPSAPGSYYFFCVVHGSSMQGTYTVQ